MLTRSQIFCTFGRVAHLLLWANNSMPPYWSSTFLWRIPCRHLCKMHFVCLSPWQWRMWCCGTRSLVPMQDIGLHCRQSFGAGRNGALFVYCECVTSHPLLPYLCHLVVGTISKWNICSFWFFESYILI